MALLSTSQMHKSSSSRTYCYSHDGEEILKVNNLLYIFVQTIFHTCYRIELILPLFSTVVPAIVFVFLSCRPFVAITTKGLQDRNINTIAGTTVENKGKLILTEIFPSVQKHDIF